MTLRILHAADIHLGLPFRRYPDQVAERLRDERFKALERLVSIGNERHADFLVIAGDLFDRTSVGVAEVRRAADVLRNFAGEAALVLAGNHDYCESAESKLWKLFQREVEGTNVIPLLEPTQREFAVHDQRVSFYPCPCPSKTGAESVIGWVSAIPKASDVVHVGIAHGNVDGFGLDANHRYFNMTESALREAGVGIWLLGHIHVPYPPLGHVGNPTFFMAGVHTPDSLRCTHGGNAWWIEIESGGKITWEALSTGQIRFQRLERQLYSEEDIVRLSAECRALSATNTILDLRLTGRMSTSAKQALGDALDSLSSQFLHFSVDAADVATLLDRSVIASRYPDGTIPSRLLTALLSDVEHPDDAMRALSIMDEVSER